MLRNFSPLSSNFPYKRNTKSIIAPRVDDACIKLGSQNSPNNEIQVGHYFFRLHQSVYDPLPHGCRSRHRHRSDHRTDQQRLVPTPLETVLMMIPICRDSGDLKKPKGNLLTTTTTTTGQLTTLWGGGWWWGVKAP